MMATTPKPQSLFFSIETNAGFLWSDESAPSANLLLAINQFNLGIAQKVEGMTKRNTASSLYRVATDKGIFILRSTDFSHAEILEEQCTVSQACSEGIIHPIKTARGTYTAEIGGKAWIAYPYQAGEIFTGNENLTSIFYACAQLSSRLALSPARKLFSVLHAPAKWKETFRFLWAPEKATVLSEFISADTKALLDQRKDSIEAWIADAEGPKSRVLTHNDLNHANLLIQGNQVTAIDLEDICYEDKNISAAHCLFKLIRHALYAQQIDLKKARNLLLQSVGSLKAHDYAIRSIETFFKYASFRILSEIHMILTRIFIIKSANKPKDLEKKIHNLFELEQICSI